jgi:hypothetical protein
VLVGGRASFTVYPSGLAIGPGTELLATAQSGPGHDPGAEGKQAPGLWPGVGCRLGVDYFEGHHAFFLVLGEDLAPSLSLTASWPRSPPHPPASSPTPSVNASSTGRVPPRRPPKYGGLPFRSALGDRSVHCCRWFAHRLRIQHGPRVRARPVADASGAPVPPRPGTDWPAGHGKAGPSLGWVSEVPRVAVSD